MKLKKLLKIIGNDTVVSIGFDGECLCTCKVKDIEKKLIESDFRVVSIGSGIVFSTREGTKINIYCE